MNSIIGFVEGGNMFANFFKQNKKLEKERNNLLKENQKLRKINWNNNLKITKAKILATKTIKKLDEIQNIDRKGIREESKRKERNVLICDWKENYSEIIKQLTDIKVIQ